MKKYLVFLSVAFICLGGFSQIPTAGLVAFYPFNGNANDESGNNHDGSLSGPVLTFDRCGVANSAYHFDGIDDYINLITDYDYPKRTINLWFYAETIDLISRHIYISDNPDLSNGFSQIKIMITDGLKEIRSSSGINGPIAEAHAIVKENEWHMVTLAADMDSARHYLDGRLIGTFKNGTNTSMAGYHSALLGTSRVFDRFYKGDIDDVRIYDRTLDEDEIMRLYLMDCNFIELSGLTRICPGSNRIKYSVPMVPGYLDYEWQYSGQNVTIDTSVNEAYLSFSSSATSGTLTVKASGEGMVTLTTTLNISLNSLPVAGNPIIGQQEVCQDTGNVLYTTSAIDGADSYDWNFSGENVTIQKNELDAYLFFFGNATSGNLTVYGINVCGAGIASQKFPIIVKNCSETPATLHIPNSFSPNQDGTNDQFVIRGLPENSSLMVFDRSGQEVFKSDKYHNDWNGRDTDGNILESGTYWYVLTVPDLKNDYKGFVYLKK